MRRTAAAILALAAISDGTTVRAEFPKFEIPRLGIFRKKKEDPPPAPAPQQPAAVPAAPAKTLNPSVATLKSDRSERNRTAAAVALRTIDPRTDADVMPTLMTSLQQDPAPGVRAAVAETIGKLKPISAEAGAILEGVVVSDPSDAVRKAAQAALWDYHLNGYRSSAANAAMPQTAEPPLAKPKPIQSKPPVPGVLVSQVPATTSAPASTVAPVARPISTGIGRGAIYPQTIEPPLARPKPMADIKPPIPSIQVPELRADPVAVEKKDAKADANPGSAVGAIPGIPLPPPATVLTIPPPSGK